MKNGTGVLVLLGLIIIIIFMEQIKAIYYCTKKTKTKIRYSYYDETVKI